MIIKLLVVGPLASNCYIVGDEATNEGVVVDPADEAEIILQSVAEFGLTIKSIILTHGHPDHIAALKEVKEATGAEIAIHTGDSEYHRQQALALTFGSRPHLRFPLPVPAPSRQIAQGWGQPRYR